MKLHPDTKVITGFVALAVLFAVIPALFLFPGFNKQQHDIPHAGFVTNYRETNFVLSGKKKHETTIFITASTSITGGNIKDGDFVQVFGERDDDPSSVEAVRINVLTPPNKRP